MRQTTSNIALLGFALCAGCVDAMAAEIASCNSLQAAQWIIGDWISRSEDRTARESWRRLNDDTFEGEGVTTRISDAAPVDGESLRLVRMGNGVFYIAKVAHNQLPIAFALTQCSAQRLVFENRNHDFPKQLEYELRGQEMTVRVGDGGEKGFTLVFRRGS
jgi:Domain of unknown function (DUF6265)